MLAYHNKSELKIQVMEKMRNHRQADELIKGRYWEDGKGCAVGCLLESSNHAEYESRFGIPQMLARLEDCIFEGLPNEKALVWPERFLNTIKPGADLSLVGWKFLYWNLTENLILKDSTDPEVQKVTLQCREAIKQCGDVICPISKGQPINESVAWSAWSAAESARSVAWSAWSAAESARSAAWSAAYEKMADKLIELLEEAI